MSGECRDRTCIVPVHCTTSDNSRTTTSPVRGCMMWKHLSASLPFLCDYFKELCSYIYLPRRFSPIGERITRMRHPTMIQKTTGSRFIQYLLLFWFNKKCLILHDAQSASLQVFDHCRFLAISDQFILCSLVRCTHVCRQMFFE